MQPSVQLHQIGVMRETRWILRGIDWLVPQGACCAILGPNGSGKSTLARIIGCHLWPTEGSCSVLGQEFGSANLPELRKQIRLVQPAGPYDVDPSLTARQVVLTGFFASISLYDRPSDEQSKRADELLDFVGLHELAGQTYSHMSSGERVRSLLARALAGDPRLLLLDEPTAGLDLFGREQFLSTLTKLAHRGGPTIVIITHHVEELPPEVSNVLLLENGTIAASGRPEAVLRSQTLSKVYRCNVKVDRHEGRFYLRVDSGIRSTN